MQSVAPADTDELSYEVLTALPAVAALAPEWDALLARSGCNLAFSSARWFVAACRLQTATQPCVVTARRNATLAGLLPLVLSHEGTTVAFPAGESDYNDMLTAPDDGPVMAGLLRHALTLLGDQQKLVLEHVRADSNCLRAAQCVQGTGKRRQFFQTTTSCPFIRLPETYEEYLRTRSRGFRTSLRQARRDADRHHVRVRELEPEQFAPARLPALFLSLHLERFAAHSPLAAPAAQAFVQEVFPGLFAERRLRAFALFAAEQIIALNVCMVGPDSLCLWNGGFNAAAARWSPGKLLIDAGIRRAYELRLAEYDLLRGLEAYKARWATNTRAIGQLEFRLRDRLHLQESD
ncbi:MAG TPA: GNAT family N-acetyltransferase [Pyrinomonadaceae bacterium]|jgi:CelD/BcsL family acetyltransferase involved in cellulose biosynthesis